MKITDLAVRVDGWEEAKKVWNLFRSLGYDFVGGVDLDAIESLIKQAASKGDPEYLYVSTFGKESPDLNLFRCQESDIKNNDDCVWLLIKPNNFAELVVLNRELLHIDANMPKAMTKDQIEEVLGYPITII
jgi:hypothetical protein